MKEMLKGIVAGVFSGAVVTATLWMIAQYFFDGIAAAAGSLLSMGFGGPAPPPPSLSYDWARYGTVIGIVVGLAVGLCAGLTGPGVRGRVVGMLTAAVCWAVSAAAAVYVAGLMMFDGELFLLAVALLAASVLLGAFLGAATDFLFRRFGRLAEESSAL